MAKRLIATAAARRALALVVGLALVTPAPANAQGLFSGYKKWAYTILGAAVAGIPAYIISDAETFGGSCSSRGCVTALAAVFGGGVGFLIGRELDARYARQMSAGPSMDYDFRNVTLDLVPDRITPFHGGAAIVGLGGARVVMDDGSVLSRAFGVRGIEDAAVMPELDLLVLSTASSLLAFPVSADSGRGQVIDDRGGSAMELFEDRLAVAGLDSLRLLALSRSAGETSIETLAGRESFEFITDMAFSSYRRVGWVLMEDRLASFNSNLEKIAEIQLPVPGRSLRSQGNRLAVAAGTNGVLVLDIADPSAPRVVQRYEGVRFAYAADLSGDLMYVAAGPEGLVVVDLGAAVPEVVGVAREVDFATDVAVGAGGEAWILDRDGRQVQIARFGVEALGSTR